MRYVRQYIVAIWSHWVSRMSGIAGILFIIVALIFRLTEIGQARYWIVAAVLSYIVASFAAWRKERLAIGNLERTIESLNQSIEGLDQAEGGTSLTPEELIGIFKDRTTMQEEKLAAAHIGKWMTVAGLVSDIRRGGKDIYVVFVGEVGKPILGMTFDEKWVEPVSALVKGNNISVRGQISRIDASVVGPEHCELVKF